MPMSDDALYCVLYTHSLNPNKKMSFAATVVATIVCSTCKSEIISASKNSTLKEQVIH